MTLAVPTSRTSLLRPLNESELYDNPDTPGTTYSFQEQSTPKPSTQSSAVHHLGLSMMDAAMHISTDDEMLDSDSDHRRDEDFDIDIDAEVYSANGGDLEVVMAMEDDPVGYSSHFVPEVDNDDLMLDDYSENYDASYGGQVVATTDDTQPDMSDSVVPTLSHQETFFQQPSPPSQLGHDHQELQASISQTALSQPDTSPTFSELQPTQANGDRESVDAASQPQATSPASHQDPPTQPHISFEEENDGTQSSTATLSHEATGIDEQNLGEDTSQQVPQNEIPDAENEYSHTSHDEESSGVENPYDSLYQHPVIVQYEQNQLTLFPSMADWSEDPILAHIYKDIPSDYLLPDVSVCDKPLSELFMHLRDVLGPSVGPGSELVVEIQLFGLKLAEDNVACKSVSLRRVLDVHNRLHENDGYDIPVPVNMFLYTAPRFYNRLEEILAFAQAKKGVQECLSLLGLPPVDEYSNEDMANRETDVADCRETLSPPQNGTEESREDGTPKSGLQHVQDVASQNGDVATNDKGIIIDNEDVLDGDEGVFDNEGEVFTGGRDAIVHNEKTVTSDGNPIENIIANDEDDNGSVRRNSETNAIIQQSSSDRGQASPAPDEESEEELLDEFENDQGDDLQGCTEQLDPANQPREDTSVEDELLDLDDKDENDSYQGDVATVQIPSTEHSAAIRGPSPSVADSDQDHTLPNLDNSNKSSPDPVFGRDEEDQGEYGDEQNFEDYRYEQENGHAKYGEQPQQGVDNRGVNQNSDNGAEEPRIAVNYGEANEERQYTESTSHQTDDELDAPGEFYDENEGEYMEQEEAGYIQENEYEVEVQEYDEVEVLEHQVEEYDDTPNATPENESSVDEVEVLDAASDVIEITVRSPDLSTHEEELIDYEDDEEDTAPQSPMSLKRLRDDSRHSPDDGLDIDQASKRARAE